MTEQVLMGKHFRILRGTFWDRISFWKKASDIEFNDGTNGEENKPPYEVLKRKKNYNVGDVVKEPSALSFVIFECITSGETASTVPSGYSSIYRGTITDGTAVFKAYVIRCSFETRLYDAGAVMLNPMLEAGVASISYAKNLADTLEDNGKKFYFDYRDGVYGYNTNPNRYEETFFPFTY